MFGMLPFMIKKLFDGQYRSDNETNRPGSRGERFMSVIKNFLSLYNDRFNSLYLSNAIQILFFCTERGNGYEISYLSNCDNIPMLSIFLCTKSTEMLERERDWFIHTSILQNVLGTKNRTYKGLKMTVNG